LGSAAAAIFGWCDRNSGLVADVVNSQAEIEVGCTAPGMPAQLLAFSSASRLRMLLPRTQPKPSRDVEDLRQEKSFFQRLISFMVNAP
jgi:hypothetical protein